VYKRLIILSVIVLAAMSGLIGLGYYSIRIRALGMEGARLGEFAAVAEQIRQDVARKLDVFVQTEQNRPYTDYQYYYVPENIAPGQQQMPVLRSPLAGQMGHGLAYGYFQIEPDGDVITPNDFVQQQEAAFPDDELSARALSNRLNIEDNLLPVLNGTTPGSFRTSLRGGGLVTPPAQPESSEEMRQAESVKSKMPPNQRGKDYPIESLRSQGQKAQVIEQKRSVVEENIANQAAQSQLMFREDAVRKDSRDTQLVPPRIFAPQTGQPADMYGRPPSSSAESQSETVQVRIEPFVPAVVPSDPNTPSVFGGQVFLLRHIQIEDRHFVQGFQLNEKELIEETKESAARFMREGMSFDLSQNGKTQSSRDVAYAAVLNFGFGDLVLNLKETDPGWIGKRIAHLRIWYFGIVGVMLVAVSLGLASLWRNAQAQLRLAQKKDDFISAVSHELRTPLTSIRMYAEMLEKNWVKSQDKAAEYHKNMRQECERLSRLVENVLDFSRIQRGRKTYSFHVGDLNKSVADAIDMMQPQATTKGFSIHAELGPVEEVVFDGDAVTQIVVNLVDNAVKYAQNAEDKRIVVRTKRRQEYVVIEVEDRGPGVPRRQQKKIFEQFYRAGAEATREAVGTGLGLALVKKFAEAHRGFVEIVSAKPTGVIFRVALSADL
jgi:signal transduction histidine kinase